MLPLADLHALRAMPQRDRYSPSCDPVALRAREILRQMEAERKSAARARTRARRRMLLALLARPLRLVRRRV